MRRIHLIVTIALSFLALTGCDGWDDGSEYAYGVFSDDGLGVAAVRMTFQEKDVFTHTKKKDFSVQVLMKENINSGKPAVLTPLVPGHVLDLFYMRSQGYLILGRETEWLGSASGGQTSERWYEHIDMNGQVTTIASGQFPVSISCSDNGGSSSTAPPIRVIPSPDGLTLALYESQVTCSERVETVTFLDAHGLNVVAGPYDVPDLLPDAFGDGVIWQPSEMGWTADGAFATAHWGHGPDFDSYWATLFPVGGEPVEDVVLGIDCLHPVTTSSEVTAEGLIVDIHSETGQLNYEDSTAPVPGMPGGASHGPMTFGCAQ